MAKTNKATTKRDLRSAKKIIAKPAVPTKAPAKTKKKVLASVVPASDSEVESVEDSEQEVALPAPKGGKKGKVSKSGAATDQFLAGLSSDIFVGQNKFFDSMNSGVHLKNINYYVTYADLQKSTKPQLFRLKFQVCK